MMLTIHSSVGCETIAQLEVAVKALVAVCSACADDLLKIGAGVTVDAEARASIVACVAAILTVSPTIQTA